MAIFQELLVISFAGASAYSATDIWRDKKRASFFHMWLELVEKYINACKIEISEMKISVGDLFQPSGYIWWKSISRYEDNIGFSISQAIVEKWSVIPYFEKILHILDTYDKRCDRGNKGFPVCDIHSASFRRVDNESLIIQHAFYTMKCIHQKPRRRSFSYSLRISWNGSLHRTGIVIGNHRLRGIEVAQSLITRVRDK